MSWPFGDPGVLLAAGMLDLLFGDPSNRLHPVAAMGGLIAGLRKRAPVRGRWKPLLAGMTIVIIGVGLSVIVGLLPLLLRRWEYWVGVVVEVVLLKTTFSVRGLAWAAWDVGRALERGDRVEARRLLAWHLVSRDTTSLDDARTAAAVIESVAENTSDGVVAPWLYYLLGGLPAALAYRFVNTADAMLGYRDPEREWLGKFPARFDDVLNWLPARMTAGLLILAAPLVGGDAWRGLTIWWRDANKTASPNAGHPMATAAGVLGVELEKVGCYRLGAGQRLPAAPDVRRGVRLLFALVGLVFVVLLVRLLTW